MSKCGPNSECRDAQARGHSFVIITLEKGSLEIGHRGCGVDIPDRDIELFSLSEDRPERFRVIISAVVEMAVDQGAEEAMLCNGSLKLGGGSFRVLHGQGCEGLKARMGFRLRSKGIIIGD